MSNLYEDKKEKVSEVKNSAIALLIVGILGLIFTTLVFFDIINLRMNISWKFISCSVIGIFSLFLLIMGFFSAKSIKNIIKVSNEEDLLTDEITKWYKSSLNKEIIDNAIKNTESDYSSLNEGDLYFYRSAIIKKLLTEKFVNLDESYTEHITEKIYQDLFENDD